MKQLSNLTKVMFCIVAVLLVITVVLGIATVVKDGKKDTDSNQTSGTLLSPPPSVDGSQDATATPTATETPTPTPTPAGHKIALDPGQQKNAMTADEPVGPGSSTMVDKMSYGATSTTTGKREYEWSLLFTLKVKEELVARGYQVILTREENDVELSNADRAKFVNESGAEVYVSIQADAASNAEAKGIYAQVPTKNNSFIGNMYEQCKNLASCMQSALIKETGAKDRGLSETDKVTTLNWSKVPVTVLQLGFMSNKEEDTNLWSDDYQKKMVKAICDGIDAYFESVE